MRLMKSCVFSQASMYIVYVGKHEVIDIKVYPQIINHPENKEIILHITFILKKLKEEIIAI